MPRGTPPKRPALYAEETLIRAILSGAYPPGSSLPPERELAERMGVTRPTLREVLGRLERDGWLTIHHGKPTLVNDFWTSGGLNVVSGVVRYAHTLPPDFVPNLLELRLHISPIYARAAIERSAEKVAAFLEGYGLLDDTPRDFADFDWRLHHLLTAVSGNPIYTLILNGFGGFYERMARLYFRQAEAREASRSFYKALLAAARRADGPAAERITKNVMRQSLDFWREANEKALERTARSARHVTEVVGR
jgi:GntR family negative regulator for fad regulon and positive regulator of fabA